MMADLGDPRRRRILTAGIAGAGVFLSSLSLRSALAADNSKRRGDEKEVGAVEGLMREHGVLRPPAKA
jgi:hypothetical protein